MVLLLSSAKLKFENPNAIERSSSFESSNVRFIVNSWFLFVSKESSRKKYHNSTVDFIFGTFSDPLSSIQMIN
jgi:hypothetical protein